MSKWMYLNEEFTSDDIKDNYGFIYLITFTDGKKYIGKKNLVTETNQKARLDGEPREGHVKFFGRNKDGKRVQYEKTITENKGWKRYEGSAKYKDGREVKSKVIIKLCKTSYDLTYWEMYYLFIEGALFRDIYLNQAIGRVFFAGDRLTGSKKYIKEYDESRS